LKTNSLRTTPQVLDDTPWAWGFINVISSKGDFIPRTLIKAGAAHFGTSNILVAEARALRDGVRAVVDSGFKRVLIEGDNSSVIQALQGHITVPWQIAGLIHDVSNYLNQLDHVSITHIFREANMAADWLSKAGHSLVSPIVWCYPPPWSSRISCILM